MNRLAASSCVLVMAVSLSLLGGCDRSARNKDREGKMQLDVVKEFAGRPAARAIAHFAPGPVKFTMIDEPPGKLRAVEFVSRRGGQPRKVTLRLKYTIKLFSAERAWSREAIESATVEDVVVK